ncbi:MAG: tRNA (N(6)-L-threonylcarbamoyladenosine(37)-C(2))-methylthiotransferase MtaB [Pseudomonadota bacterium]
MSVEVINFGCRLNIAEGEAIRAAAAGADDLIVINSCAVTAEATRQARQAVRRAAKRRPDARIIVTGCAAEVDPAMFAGMAEVVGNRAKGQATSYHALGTNGLSRPALSGADHARAFVEVQNGCDHRCTFCIIPYGRGESRSVPAGLVIDAVKQAVDRGQQEVILTGVDLTSYGPDLPGNPTLGMLVERILTHVPELKRLRLSSMDSVEIDDRLFDLISGEARIMPHIHLSLQSGDDMILKRMKRRHSRVEAVELVKRLKAKRPALTIGADIIAGFPTEDEAMFANSLALLDDCDIVLGHIFPFSPRTGTPAARMPQLARATVKARAETLRTRASERKASWLQSLIETRQKTLIELDQKSGHAENFASVRLETPLPLSNMRGTMVDVQITASDGHTLTGIPV